LRWDLAIRRISGTHFGDGLAKRRKTFDGSLRRLLERSALDSRALIRQQAAAGEMARSHPMSGRIEP
jgi:hypothetical protein